MINTAVTLKTNKIVRKESNSSGHGVWEVDWSWVSKIRINSYMWRYDTVDIVAVVESLQRCGKQPHCLSDLCSNDCHSAHRTFLRYTPACLTSIKHQVKREIFGKRMNVPSVSTWFFKSQNRALSSMCHKMWNSNVHHHHHPWVCVVATTRTTWELHCVIEARHFMFGNKKCVINKKKRKEVYEKHQKES